MKIQIKAYVTWNKHEWDEKPYYTIDACDMSGVGAAYVTIREQTFDVEIPVSPSSRSQLYSRTGLSSGGMRLSHSRGMACGHAPRIANVTSISMHGGKHTADATRMCASGRGYSRGNFEYH